jgi:hypothetical protein
MYIRWNCYDIDLIHGCKIPRFNLSVRLRWALVSRSSRSSHDIHRAFHGR